MRIHLGKKYMKLGIALLVVGMILVAGGAQATIFNYVLTLDGLQETPPNASPGSGSGTADINDVANTVTLFVTFSGLVGSQTAAHIHTGAVAVAGPVIVPLPLGSPISGTFSLTAPQVALMLAGDTYVNVHSTLFPGGEIRGQIVVPEPGTLSLVVVALGAGFLFRVKRAKR